MAEKSLEQMAQEAPKKGDAVDIGPDSNMAALMTMADEILAQPVPGEADAAGAPAMDDKMDKPMDDAPMDDKPADMAPADDAPEGEMMGGTDLSPIEDMLKMNNEGMSDAEASQKAGDLWNAAGERADLAQMTPKELTDELKKDSGLLTELMKLAARGEPEGGEMMGGMAAAEPPAGAPPMGAPPMGGMMPGGM